MSHFLSQSGYDGPVSSADRFNQAAFRLAGMTGSIEHAAHLLSISPLAMSTRVRSLERELGVRLFERHERKLTLTEAEQRIFGQRRRPS